MSNLNSNVNNNISDLLAGVEPNEDVKVSHAETSSLDKNILKDSLKELLAKYETIEAARNNANNLLKEAVAEQSLCVEEIAKVYAKIAPGKKKISYKGETLSIVCRPHSGGETWFLRGRSKNDDAFEIL